MTSATGNWNHAMMVVITYFVQNNDVEGDLKMSKKINVYILHCFNIEYRFLLRTEFNISNESINNTQIRKIN